MPLVIFIIFVVHITSVNAKPLNTQQIIGSHNSYKKILNVGVKHKLNDLNSKLMASIDYGHSPITKQLNSGVRHLEIDVLKDPNGDLYIKPWANSFATAPLFNELEKKQLATPGFKVMHIPDIDVQSHCVLLSGCLNTLKTWSEANPQHFPIVVMLNVKETRSDLVLGNNPLKFTSKDYYLLDEVIRKSLPSSLFTPDNLRKIPLSLNQTVVKFGWPSTRALAGKFIFLFDGNTQQSALYKQNRPSLKGASMFANYDESEPEAAFMVVNNPTLNFYKIQQLVLKGYMVRTRADATLSATNSQRTIQFNAAKSSGAQVISTDFIPGSPQQARFNYVVQFDEGHLVRTNPFVNNQL
ncbi:Ca2+-dependent phosphoinositide-specific phospholipase C [Pseudoalteromonas aliena]|uniref:Ca2+-dependent phosphoinositide-specific phospholipase C n=1 Tax=Pseudoalteromonas aliena TaxID=247523 RepID=UPI00311D7952